MSENNIQSKKNDDAGGTNSSHPNHRGSNRTSSGRGSGGNRRPYRESSGGYRPYNDRPRRNYRNDVDGGENTNAEGNNSTMDGGRDRYDRPYRERRSNSGYQGDRPRRPRNDRSFGRSGGGRNARYINAGDVRVRSSGPGGNRGSRMEYNSENSGERPYYQRDEDGSGSGARGDGQRRFNSRRPGGSRGGFNSRPYRESSGGYRPYNDRPRRNYRNDVDGGENTNAEGNNSTMDGGRDRYDRPYRERRSNSGYQGDRPRRPRNDRSFGRSGGARHSENKEGGRKDEFVDYSDLYSRDPARISHRLSYIGSWSRRSAEEIVEAGRVKINGEVVTDLGRMVSYADEIIVDDKKMDNSKQKIEVYAFNKPRECLTTMKDPEGRKTIFDILPDRYKSLKTIGRLDFNSEGLLLLTNNGYYSRAMEMPSSEVRREYRVRLFGDDINSAKFDALRDGIEIDGIRYGPVDVNIDPVDSDSSDSKNVWVTVSLYEGKNREIRRIMEHLGFEVSKLIRTSYGNYHLGKLPPGYVINVTHKLRSSNVKNYYSDHDVDIDLDDQNSET